MVVFSLPALAFVYMTALFLSTMLMLFMFYRIASVDRMSKSTHANPVKMSNSLNRIGEICFVFEPVNEEKI